jgi:hypothetical protein
VKELEEKLHRTWVQFLLDSNHPELAAMGIDAEVKIEYGNWNPDIIFIDLPPASYEIVTKNESFSAIMTNSLDVVSCGYIHDQNGNDIRKIPIDFRIQLLNVEPKWQDKIRELIQNPKATNQGTLLEKIFARDGKQPLIYNEMKFGSRSEVRIAQELESRRVLFFPLPLAVRSDTGAPYLDRREPDFLICQDGIWGILEVAYHPDRYEKDSEKSQWFKKSRILCVEYYTAERCFNSPAEVVEEFLQILAKHKR